MSLQRKLNMRERMAYATIAKLEQQLAEAVAVLASTQEQFKRFGGRLPDGFDTRVFRMVDDAVAAHAISASAEPRNTCWRDMEKAPRDGTMLRLLVEFTDHSTDDDRQAITIGHNSRDNTGEDEWQFAGWCWTHDHYTEGKGEPVGWLPMLDGIEP